MHPASLLRVKRELLLSDLAQLSGKVTRLMGSDDPGRVQAAITRLREDAH